VIEEKNFKAFQKPKLQKASIIEVSKNENNKIKIKINK